LKKLRAFSVKLLATSCKQEEFEESHELAEKIEATSNSLGRLRKLRVSLWLGSLQLMPHS